MQPNAFTDILNELGVDKMTDNTFSSILKFTRIYWKNTMTVRSLHEKSGLSHPYISQLENGKRRSLPNPEILAKLASGFGESNEQLTSSLYVLFMSACNYIAVDFESILHVSKHIYPSNQVIEKIKMINGNCKTPQMAAFRYYAFVLGFTELNKYSDSQLKDRKIQLQFTKNKEDLDSSLLQAEAYLEGANEKRNLNLIETNINENTIQLDNETLNETEREILLGAINTIRSLRTNSN